MPVDQGLIPRRFAGPSLSWRRAGPVVRSMTVGELVAALSTVPGARHVPVDAPLTSGFLVAGIEIATTGPATERTLRKLWRDRRGDGATPLLLVADDPARPGCVSALGAVDAG